MGSFLIQDFLGNGALKDLGDKLADDGWDDVPTLKMIGAEDMEALDLSESQRDALELRIYLHDRSLMEYADNLEASKQNLIDLISTSPAVLSSQYGMRKTHVARFIDRSIACGIQMPPTLSLASRKRSVASRASDDTGSEYSATRSKPGTEAPKTPSPTSASLNGPPSIDAMSTEETPSMEEIYFASKRPPSVDGQSENGLGMRPVGASKPNAAHGIFSAPPASARMCGLIQAQHVREDVTQLAVLEKVFVRTLAPEHKKGVDPFTMKDLKMPPPFKASNLWANQSTLLFCLRRPGCVMCRAEAHQLYARKPIFDAMGIQLVAVLNEHIDSEVKAFWPRYWGGMVVVDEKREFFKALGGGQLLKENLFSGFIFNPIARSNWKRAKATGMEYTGKGEGTIKGGLYIVKRGKGGVAYQFIERNFGDWAPLEEILQVGTNIKNEEEAEEHVHEQ